MSTPIKNIEVDARLNAYYDSFYLEALDANYTTRNRKYETFTELNNSERLLCLKIYTGDSQYLKVIIDSRDTMEVSSSQYHWCNCYAKVNIALNEPLLGENKLLSIPPSFSIRRGNYLSTAMEIVGNQLALKSVTKNTRKEIAKDFIRPTRHRLSTKSYTPEIPIKNYVFFAGSLWMKEPATNNFRANFIRAVRKHPALQFEGGFAKRSRGKVEGFDAETMEGNYPLTDYLAKIKQSAFVFNTPAVFACHGWKLGEFMALGKLIISTPLSRLLPGEFQPHVHYYPVDGSEASIRVAIDDLLQDEAKCTFLVKNVIAYYHSYASQQAVLKSILDFLGVHA
jgi:hypothetical protein